MASLSIGKTTYELRCKLARRSEFMLTDDQNKVLDMLLSEGYFQLHPRQVAKALGWVVYRAARVIDEIADVFDLVSVSIKSPWGVFSGYQWGAWVESQSWPVVGWWDDAGEYHEGPPAGDARALAQPPAQAPEVIAVDEAVLPTPEKVSYSPVSTTDTVSSTDTVSASDSAITASAARALDSTMMKNLDAAESMIRHTMSTHGMDPETAADALISISRSGKGITRATINSWTPEPLAPVVPEVSEAEFERVMTTSAKIKAMVQARPETAGGAVFLNAVCDYRPVTVSAFHADRWESQASCEARCEFTDQDVYAAVELVHERKWSMDPLTVGRVIRERVQARAGVSA